MKKIDFSGFRIALMLVVMTVACIGIRFYPESARFIFGKMSFEGSMLISSAVLIALGLFAQMTKGPRLAISDFSALIITNTFLFNLYFIKDGLCFNCIVDLAVNVAAMVIIIRLNKTVSSLKVFLFLMVSNILALVSVYFILKNGRMDFLWVWLSLVVPIACGIWDLMSQINYGVSIFAKTESAEEKKDREKNERLIAEEKEFLKEAGKDGDFTLC